jgi:aromatic ring-opening dioxygenase catalytic subunit (LigB family)
MSATEERLPTLFIPHGGGPCFFIEPRPGSPDIWGGMAAYLCGISGFLGRKPKAILAISGHWETERITVNSGQNPPLLFDYYGFPEHTYKLRYPAPGSPALAREVRQLLAAAGFASDEQGERGFDHGVFIPFMLIYPAADVPIIQLSLQQDLDPAIHLAIGRALSPLREQGVLIVGSGMSYHNMQGFSSNHPGSLDASRQFDDWLFDAVTEADPTIRDRKLSRWDEAPCALACHPREEHLLPLMVAAGAAGSDKGCRTYHEQVLGKALSGFQFG